MTIRQIFAAGQMLEISGAGYDPDGEFSRNGSIAEPSPAPMALLRAAVLASDAHLVQNSEGGQWHIKGDRRRAHSLWLLQKPVWTRHDL